MEIDNTPKPGGIKKTIYITMDELMNHSCTLNAYFNLHGKWFINYKIFKINLYSEVILN